VKQYLHGAAAETSAEVKELAAGLREHYKPEGILEELLVQKIAVESARNGRVVALEQPEPGYNPARVVHCLDRTSGSASMDAEPAKRPAELNERHPEKEGENPASSDSRAVDNNVR